MSEIIIRNCKKLSNDEALEAIRLWIFKNSTEKDYSESRVVILENGSEVYIKEQNHPNKDSNDLCNVLFETELISRTEKSRALSPPRGTSMPQIQEYWEKRANNDLKLIMQQKDEIEKLRSYVQKYRAKLGYVPMIWEI